MVARAWVSRRAWSRPARAASGGRSGAARPPGSVASRPTRTAGSASAASIARRRSRPRPTRGRARRAGRTPGPCGAGAGPARASTRPSRNALASSDSPSGGSTAVVPTRNSSGTPEQVEGHRPLRVVPGPDLAEDAAEPFPAIDQQFAPMPFCSSRLRLRAGSHPSRAAISSASARRSSSQQRRRGSPGPGRARNRSRGSDRSGPSRRPSARPGSARTPTPAGTPRGATRPAASTLARSSGATTPPDPASPCRQEFRREASLPSGVLGPVEPSEFFRLASICASVVMVGALRMRVPGSNRHVRSYIQEIRASPNTLSPEGRSIFSRCSRETRKGPAPRLYGYACLATLRTLRMNFWSCLPPYLVCIPPRHR